MEALHINIQLETEHPATNIITKRLHINLFDKWKINDLDIKLNQHSRKYVKLITDVDTRLHNTMCPQER